MTDHPETHAPESAHDHGHDAADSKLDIAKSLKFEPLEIQEFEQADKSAGQMMGKLLGFLFCVLITLMSGVNIWMIGRNSTGFKDPQDLTRPLGDFKTESAAAPEHGHH